MFLDKQSFSNVIESTPLVSIDLIIEDEQGQVLLGERLNRPAQGYWFVPGGRVRKGETLSDAFVRLTQEELGTRFELTSASLIGPFTHLYDDNVFNERFSTHYVAIAYKLRVNRADLALPMNIQHSGYRWFSVDELKLRDDVHTHTKWYFEPVCISK